MDNTKRFDGRSELYAKGRPQYAAGLFEYLKNTLGAEAGSVFADVGSGTGIFTAQLLERGYRVFAVEPNRDMREKAEERLSRNANFLSVNGSDGSMGIPDRSVDFVTAAQAFHWFGQEAFRRECRRVLKPGGRVLLVYNSRDEGAPCTRALAELRRKYRPEFRGFSNGVSDAGCRAFFDGACTVYRADNTQRYDRQGYIDRALSSSYSLRENDDGYAAYLKELHGIFDRFSVNGLLTVPTDTVAYIGTV